MVTSVKIARRAWAWLPLNFIFFTLLMNVQSTMMSPLSMLIPSSQSQSNKVNHNDDNYVIGVDAGTESIRVGVFTRHGHMISTAVVPWKTSFPHPGWAEQSPNEWWGVFGQACKEAMKSIDISKVVGISVDTTACSVVFLDDEMKPLRPCLLWMDGRSAPQCQEILEKGRGDPALRVNCNGEGPLSAEWMIPKSLWVKQNEPDTWKNAKIVCEKQDYFNLMLTGRLVCSSCNVAARWHWDVEAACTANTGSESGLKTNKDPTVGRPVSLLHKIGMSDLLDKWPSECVAMGDVVGFVSEAASNHLGIPAGIPVTQGGPDAYVGMIGLGSVAPNELSLITGSSHLHLAVSQSSATAAGVWGAYKGAPLIGLCFAEGGQCSTGSVVSWARRILDSPYQQQLQQQQQQQQQLQQGEAPVNSVDKIHEAAVNSSPSPTLPYDSLNEEASRIEPGADGLLCVETFQGARTPVTDPLARGAFLGLSLAHTRGHLWRSILEGVCLGTKGAIDALARAGLTGSQIKVAGGATRSALWLQMHADATGLPVIITENDNAPLLGSALLAGVGAGWFKHSDATVSTRDNSGSDSETDNPDDKYASIRQQVYRGIRSMVRVSKRVEPNTTATERYKSIHKLYTKAVNRIADLSHTLATGSHFTAPESEGNGPNTSEDKSFITQIQSQLQVLRDNKGIQLVPSLLSADFGHLAAEAKLCEDLGFEWLHIDVCDGSTHCRGSLTVGPQTVAAIRRECPALKLDVHVVSADTETWVEPMAEAGCTRFIIQYESVVDSNTDANGHTDVLRIVKLVRQSGMACGLCIRPSTPVETIESLVQERWTDGSPLFELVDILAVNPGFGGQPFNTEVLEKVKYLRASETLRQAVKHVAIDGGINVDTVKLAVAAGANVIIAGSAVFGSNRQANQGSKQVAERIQYLISPL